MAGGVTPRRARGAPDLETQKPLTPEQRGEVREVVGVFDNLARGLLAGHQLTKGQPWQIDLSPEQVDTLRALAQRMRRSKKEAS